MIEDLQDEFQEENSKHAKRKDKAQGMSRGAFLAIAFIFWFLYAGVIGIICAPRAIVAVRESGVKSYLKNAIHQKNTANTYETGICFVLPTTETQVNYGLFIQNVPKTNATIYHDAIEGLLAGPGKDALSVGAVSFITQGTTLRGLTVSQGVAFVDFSADFSSSGSSWGPSGLEVAITQVEKTLMAVDSSITKVIILVDGSPLKDLPQLNS